MKNCKILYRKIINCNNPFYIPKCISCSYFKTCNKIIIGFIKQPKKRSGKNTVWGMAMYFFLYFWSRHLRQYFSHWNGKEFIISGQFRRFVMIIFVSSTTNNCFLLSPTSRLFSASSYQYQNFVVKTWSVELKTIFVYIRLKGMIVFRKREMCHRTLQMKKMIVCRYSPLSILVAPDYCLSCAGLQMTAGQWTMSSRK